MNTRNNFVLTGFFPKSDKITIKYEPGVEGGKKSYMFGKISVRRNFKDKETGKYKYDLLPFKAFGQRADYINNYVHRGDLIQLTGELQMGENRQAADGSVIYGQVELLVEEASILHSDTAAEGSEAAAPATRQPAAARQAAAGVATAPRRTGASLFANRAAKSHSVL